MKSSYSFLFICLFFLGCSNNQKPNLNQTEIVQVPTNIYDLVRFHYKNRLIPKDNEDYSYDSFAFYAKYRNDILSTLQIKDSLITENIAVALYSYSIGPVTYNGSLWFRKMDGNWKIRAYQWLSTYSDDPFYDGRPKRAKEIIEKVDNWKKSNKNVWWE